MDEIIIRYIHFTGILILFASLLAEHLLLKPEMSTAEIRRIAGIDSIYGLSALVVLATGLLQWFAVGKPSDFYTSNPVFLTKLSIFILAGLLSIYPTLVYAKYRRRKQGIIEIPAYVITLVRTQLVLILALPLLAILMARGYGYS